MRWLALALSAALLVGCAESNLIRGTTTDRTPPAVTATEPANEAQNVTEARITVTFSEPMATNTVQVR
ncbi:MAG: Ig-like domain-containing protein, partial [Armatimonadota bacterium]|nr:Ig-like domain-containing protein [Armatimonadota bacterium]